MACDIIRKKYKYKQCHVTVFNLYGNYYGCYETTTTQMHWPNNHHSSKKLFELDWNIFGSKHTNIFGTKHSQCDI